MINLVRPTMIKATGFPNIQSNIFYRKLLVDKYIPKRWAYSQFSIFHGIHQLFIAFACSA
jgi:hypothetical protein